MLEKPGAAVGNNGALVLWQTKVSRVIYLNPLWLSHQTPRFPFPPWGIYVGS